MAIQRKAHPTAPKTKELRINHQIRVPKVKLVTEGNGIEVFDTRDAIRMAAEAGLDLVEVSPDQDPPVCKIINYGKWKYEQTKKKKDQARNQHIIQIKEIKMKPKIGVHDYQIKCNHGAEFLEDGDKVKVSLRFRGREIAHPEIGMALMHRFIEDLKEISAVETPPKMEGRQIVMVLASTGKKKPTAKPAGEAVTKPKSTAGESAKPKSTVAETTKPKIAAAETAKPKATAEEPVIPKIAAEEPVMPKAASVNAEEK